ncbi:MAG: response regulator [Bacteroidota bacterium]
MGEIKHILLVDDDEPTNILHKIIIDEVDWGCTVHLAQTGKAAIEFLQTWEGSSEDSSASTIDLIFLDLNMPTMNGYEFLRAHQSLPPSKRAKVIIVMLTTMLDQAKTDLLWSLGIQGFQKKPLTEDALGKIREEFF